MITTREKVFCKKISSQWKEASLISARSVLTAKSEQDKEFYKEHAIYFREQARRLDKEMGEGKIG